MIKEILLPIFLIVSTIGYSQSDFTVIDKNSKTIPDSLTDYKEIAGYLTNDLKTDTEKARAIYVWIANNIQYDLVLLTSGKRYHSSQDIILDVLNDRKGVCQHYAELFHAMSKSAGLKSFLIIGYSKNSLGGIADLSHAWNGIKIDTNYYLIDVTWAAGYEYNGKYVHKFRDNYFLKSPGDFIKTHMPFDPLWQFLENPINNDDFISNDFSKLEANGNYAFVDSIQQYERYNELAQLEHSTRRIIESGVKNKLIQIQVDENILQITNRKYNNAVDTLNYGIDSYNLYISHKNKRFRNPKLDDSNIKLMINNAHQGIHAANEVFNELISSDIEANNLIVKSRNTTSNIISELEREKDFVDRYLRIWKPLRIFIFYLLGIKK